MQDRLYQRNVVDATPKWKELRDKFSRDYYRKLVYTLLFFVFSIVFAICSSVFISHITIYFFSPIIAGIFSRQFYLIYQDSLILKQLSLDYNDYAVWMDNQLNKGNPKKDVHLQQAVDTYQKYISNIQYNKQDIIRELQVILSRKTDNQILVSVLCGLLFLYGDKQDRDTLYRAKYKTGSAGNMVLAAWIMYYDDLLPENFTFEKLKTDFTDYWHNK